MDAGSRTRPKPSLRSRSWIFLQVLSGLEVRGWPTARRRESRRFSRWRRAVYASDAEDAPEDPRERHSGLALRMTSQ